MFDYGDMLWVALGNGNNWQEQDEMTKARYRSAAALLIKVAMDRTFTIVLRETRQPAHEMKPAEPPEHLDITGGHDEPEER